jgi:hypothetical protein
MELNLNDLKKLAKATLSKTPLTYSVNGKEETYTADAANEALRTALAPLTKDYYTFKRNENTIFELISSTIDEILPARVMKQYEQFADTITVPQGDKPVFNIRITEAARKRAKAFVTSVGLAGRYETVMLEGRQLTVNTSAYGYAIRLGFEEFLDGRYSFADFTEIMIEGLDDAIYAEIAKALDTAIDTLPAVNKASHNGFDEKEFDKLLGISDSYGNGNSTIYCTREFASTMIPHDAAWASDSIKDDLFRRGFLGTYKGHNVVILQQSVEDIDNKVKAIDPAKAYIIASVGEKPVKISFEGQTAVRTVEDNDDWSRDMQTYKKVGVAVLSNPSICQFTNTELKKVIA